jgi:hypothetical protein
MQCVVVGDIADVSEMRHFIAPGLIGIAIMRASWGRFRNGNWFKPSLWWAEVSGGKCIWWVSRISSWFYNINCWYTYSVYPFTSQGCELVNFRVPHHLRPLILFRHATSSSTVSLPRGFALWPFPFSRRDTDRLTSAGVSVPTPPLQSVLCAGLFTFRLPCGTKALSSWQSYVTCRERNVLGLWRKRDSSSESEYQVCFEHSINIAYYEHFCLLGYNALQMNSAFWPSMCNRRQKRERKVRSTQWNRTLQVNIITNAI